MRLTQQTNDSIRVLLYCAKRGREPSRVRDIARAYAISELHLFKIMHVLVEHGLVETIRGRNGGIRLARAPTEITLGEVVRAAEGNFHLSDCLDADHSCPLVEGCGLSVALREALRAFLAVLDGYTIAEVAGEPTGVEMMLAIGAQERSRDRSGPTLQPSG